MTYLNEHHERHFQLLVTNIDEMLNTQPNKDGRPVLQHIRMSAVEESLEGVLETILEEDPFMIQNAFKLWAEKERGRMLMKENWRTHHDYECYWVMNTIYRYMFRYGLTVFQIRMHAWNAVLARETVPETRLL